MNTAHKNIETYIAGFPDETQRLMRTIHAAIKKVAPDAVESISYGIPTFKFNNKPLVYFAAFKNHIGLYALPSGNAAFQKEISSYKTGKGSIQFPLSQPMPMDLITKIVRYRLEEISTPL